MSDTEGKCTICDRTHPWPDGTVPKHPFSNGESGSAAFLGRRDQRREPGPQRGTERGSMTQRPAYPIDPVLRQALVDAGVITPQQLKDAEDKIQAITGLFNQSSLSGHYPPGVRGQS